MRIEYPISDTMPCKKSDVLIMSWLTAHACTDEFGYRAFPAFRKRCALGYY